MDLRANAQGGRIYIGCDDDGHVTGLTNTRKLLEDIPTEPLPAKAGRFGGLLKQP